MTLLELYEAAWWCLVGTVLAGTLVTMVLDAWHWLSRR